MECYGILFNKRKDCRNCKLLKWCETASDPPRLSHQMLDWDTVSELATPLNMTVTHPSAEIPFDGKMDEQLYSCQRQSHLSEIC